MKLGQWLFRRADERRVLIMGLDNAGKTTLLYRWLLDEVITTIPTIGFNVETVKHPKGFAFTMWDVGGCDKIRPLYRHYFQNTQFVLFVHDCTDKERLNEQLDLLKMSMLEDELRDVPTLIVLNKQDLLIPEEREAEIAKIKKEYEKLAASCGRRAPIKILEDEGSGFSATGMENPRIVLEEMAKILTDTKGATPAKKKAVVESQAPGVHQSDAELAKAKAMVEEDNMSAKDFWRAFEDGSLTPWDHYHHLKSGFFVLVEAFEKGQGVLDAAETFIDHLERLRKGNPERFRNTTHRTMTIFWLGQLQVAAANYTQGIGSSKVLQRTDFKDVLLQSPELTNARLWENYYSKGLLFTPEAKEHWRLPDVRAMPSVTTAPSHQPTKRIVSSPPSAAATDSDRLVRFGLTVIQTLMTSKSRRGVVIKTALAALQTWTMRERAVNTVIPPYSETQAYFWIQFVHAALATESASQNGGKLSSSSSLNWNGSVDSLTLTAFKTLYGVVGNEWQAHYSAKLWESLPAQMQFCAPDKKPLPNVIQISGQSDLDAARGAMVEQYAASEKTTPRSALPTANDLAVMAAVLVNGIEEGAASDHGAMLGVFYDLLHASQDMKRDADMHKKTQSLAIMKALEIPCAGADGLTQRMFWVQQVLVALSTFQGDGFGEFVLCNPHLAYQHLPYVYYSPMLWASQEAEEVYIGPDLKPLVSRVE